jgi:hypothetical protein
MAAACTTPVDVIKTRLQVQQRGTAGSYRGALDALSRIWREEGARAFYQGLGARVLWMAPGSAICMAACMSVCSAVSADVSPRRRAVQGLVHDAFVARVFLRRWSVMMEQLNSCTSLWSEPLLGDHFCADFPEMKFWQSTCKLLLSILSILQLAATTSPLTIITYLLCSPSRLDFPLSQLRR